MESKYQETYEKMFISGKSYDELSTFIKQKHSEEETLVYLEQLSEKFMHKRIKVTKRDLIISISCWVVILVLGILKIAAINIMLHYHIMVILSFISIAFFRSYLNSKNWKSLE